MSTLMVIGGSGFFGKSILDAYKRGLLEKWKIDCIYVVARNAKKLRETNSELLVGSVELINKDIGTCQELPFADYVIHAAASSDASKYAIDPDAEKRNIISGTVNFCNLAAKKFKKSKILYISSGAVYGTNQSQLQPFSESNLFEPIENVDPNKRAYISAKRSSEAEIKNLGKLGLSVSIARCFAFIGKYLPRDQHFAIGNFFQNAIDGKSIEVKAKNNVYRSYLYADDLVSWLMNILEFSEPSCPIFNVGSDEAIEIRDLAENISKLYGVEVKYTNPSEDNPDYYIPSVNKVNQAFNIKRYYRLTESLKLTRNLLGANG